MREKTYLSLAIKSLKNNKFHMQFFKKTFNF